MRCELHFVASESSGEVSAELRRDDGAHCLVVFAHGAGAGMRHAFIEAMAERLAQRGVATLRYQFPYMEQGGRRPNPQPILLATVRSAIAAARRLASDLPVFAGGKSMGGRMTSLAASKEPLPGVRGLVFFGFPLHPIGRPGSERGDHLAAVEVPMLFLQGTRDKLADLDLLRPVCEGLGERATLSVCDGADHSFKVLKRSGRTHEEVLDEVADAVGRWTRLESIDPASSTFMYEVAHDVLLNRWFPNYEDARTSLDEMGGYLLPFKHHFFVCEAEGIRILGLDPEDPDWERIGRDWVRPRDREAWERLKDRRVEVLRHKASG